MAFVFADSFDHYADADKTSKYTQQIAAVSGGALAIGSGTGRGSTNCLHLSTGGFANEGSGKLTCVPSAPAPSGATLIAGLRFRSVSAFAGISNGTNPDSNGPSGTGCIISFLSTGSNLCWLRINPAGTLSVLRGSTVLGTTSAALTQNVYAFIELKVLLHGSTGTVDLKVDGVSVLSLTGQNTTNSGATTWDEFRFGAFSNGLGSAALNINIDDFYLLDGSGSTSNDFLGDVRVDAVFANADGTHSAFTRSTGANQYATIDEAAANGDTDYNESSAVGDLDTLNFPNAPVAGATIKAIQVVTQTRKSDFGTGEQKAVTRIGSTDYLGDARSMGTSYAFLRQLWDLKPSDSTPWTDTDFNAAEFGYKKTA